MIISVAKFYDMECQLLFLKNKRSFRIRAGHSKCPPMLRTACVSRTFHSTYLSCIPYQKVNENNYSMAELKFKNMECIQVGCVPAAR